MSIFEIAKLKIPAHRTDMGGAYLVENEITTLESCIGKRHQVIPTIVNNDKQI